MKDIEIASRSVVGNQSQSSVHSLYVLKAILAFFVVNCHIPLGLPWLSIPGLRVELFFAITGYFLFARIGKTQLRGLNLQLRKSYLQFLFFKFFIC